MPSFELDIVVPESPDNVFAYATNYDNWPEFIRDVEDLQLVEGDGSAGSVIKMKVTSLGIPLETTFKVRERDNLRWLSDFEGAIPGTTEWRYESHEDGARVVVSYEWKTPGGPIMGKLLDALVVERQFKSTVDAMLAGIRQKFTS